MDLPKLEDVLSYKNSNVIGSFLEEFDFSEEEAIDIFTEMLRFLWASSLRKELSEIDGPIVIIDKMWHTFILHTRDYTEFSIKYFGTYLHHQPILKNSSSDKKSRTDFIEIKRRKYELVYEILGREIFIKWYHLFPESYSMSRILEKRKK